MKNWKDIAWSRAEVAEIRKLAEGAFLLRFTREHPFLAGQVVALGTCPELAPRLYSLASGENDPLAEVLFTEKPDGALTPLLSHLQQGDGLMVSKPFGNFTHYTPGAVMIAAGTGIAPFMSAIRSGKAEDVTLIHGASFPEYFYFEDELTQSIGSQYLQCCSRCTLSASFPGRVTHFIGQWNEIHPEKKHYLCGSAEMVVDTRDALIGRGVPFGNIHAEIFF